MYNQLQDRENKRKKILFLLVMFSLCMGISLPVSAAATDEITAETDAEQKKNIKNGWQKEKGKTYYYKDDVKQTGWQKVSGKYYYMDKNGILQTNKIVGRKKEGYYYVDKDGVRITDAQIKYAVKFVNANTKSGWSKSQKLKACYKALSDTGKYKYQRFYGENPKAKDMADYAKYMFKNKRGNCFRYAACYAYIARVLGYDSRVVVGEITRLGGGRTPHGWTEVKVGGKWYIFDTNMQIHTSSPYFYYRKTVHPCRVWVTRRCILKSAKGRVTWK